MTIRAQNKYIPGINQGADAQVCHTYKQYSQTDNQNHFLVPRLESPQSIEHKILQTIEP